MTLNVLDDIARVAHEANRALQTVQGDQAADPWDDLTDLERAHKIRAVEHGLNGATAEQMHELWLRSMQQQGWRYGEIRDPHLRTHPGLVEYGMLTAAARVKDQLFLAIVRTLGGTGVPLGHVHIQNGDGVAVCGKDPNAIYALGETMDADVSKATCPECLAALHAATAELGHRTGPRVGDQVHYLSYGTPGGEYGRCCRAAIVTTTYGPADPDAQVALAVLNPTGLFFDQRIRHDPGNPKAEPSLAARMSMPTPTCGDREFAGGTWHWAAEVSG